MAKKEGSQSWIKEFFLKVVSTKIIDNIKEEVRTVTHDLQARLYHMQEVMMQKLFATLIMFLGFVFVTVAFVFFMIEYLEWSATISFLAVGLILVMFSFAMKYFIIKRQFKEKR